jgi:hypothetical protein
MFDLDLLHRAERLELVRKVAVAGAPVPARLHGSEGVMHGGVAQFRLFKLPLPRK